METRVPSINTPAQLINALDSRWSKLNSHGIVLHSQTMQSPSRHYVCYCAWLGCSLCRRERVAEEVEA